MSKRKDVSDMDSGQKNISSREKQYLEKKKSKSALSSAKDEMEPIIRHFIVYLTMVVMLIFLGQSFHYLENYVSTDVSPIINRLFSWFVLIAFVLFGFNILVILAIKLLRQLKSEAKYGNNK